MIRSKAEDFNWSLLSRALSNHDANTVYTLLSERYSFPVAGIALLKLIETVPDWPKANRGKNVNFSRTLTFRELQVVRCAERGLTIIETAKELILSIETIKTHRRTIFMKLDVINIAQAIRRSRELGLIT